MKIFIYSRKSKWTGRGESVENQVQMCREYINRHIEEAGTAEIEVYEDEGYSGKNTNRPEFQRMMKKMKAGDCGYLVCYKLDRIGRNIIDIASLVEELNKLSISFISIKENFDTSTPLGKTMLYIAGIFAQMEREQIAERIKDNMSMLARDGRWLGGNTPLGFSSQKEEKVVVGDKVKTSYRLQINEDEIETVRFIFKEYEEKQALHKVVEYFLKHDIRSRRGNEYTNDRVKAILTNPVYCTADEAAYDYYDSLGCQLCFDRKDADGSKGLIAYARTSSTVYTNKVNPPKEWIIAIGNHKGVIPGEVFVKIQKLVGANSVKGESFRKVRNEIALLSGILYCSCGHAMRPKYYNVRQVLEDGTTKFSYICPYKDDTHGEKCNVPNVPGNDLDLEICRQLFAYAEPGSPVSNLLKDMKKNISDSKEESFDEETVLEKAIAEKEKRMERLLQTLTEAGRSPEFISRVDSEIARLSKECQDMKAEAKKFENKGGFSKIQISQVDLLISELKSFKEEFNSLSVPKKREYLKLLLDKVVWDGEKAHIFLSGSH